MAQNSFLSESRGQVSNPRAGRIYPMVIPSKGGDPGFLSNPGFLREFIPV
jgi:hypothetical protein